MSHTFQSAPTQSVEWMSVEFAMAVTTEEADQIIAMLTAEGIKVACSKTPIEFGTLGEEP